MDGMKTSARLFVQNGQGQCIAGIALVPEESKSGSTGFRIYVAWEFEKMAVSSVFAFVKSRELVKNVDGKAIQECMDYGSELHDPVLAKVLFPYLFMRRKPKK